MIKKVKSLLKAGAALLNFRLIDPIEVYFLRDENTFYPIISKSGCSSIKLLLIRKFIPEFEAQFPGIHSVNPGPITQERLQRIFFHSKGTYQKWCTGKKMVFVMRDPVSRFYSCYLDIYKGKNIMYRYPSELNWLMGFKPGLSFETFKRKAFAIPDKFSDRHFRSQCFYLGNSLRATLADFHPYTLTGFMKITSGAHDKIKPIRLNQNADSVSEESKSTLSEDPAFLKRFGTDLKLFREIKGAEGIGGTRAGKPGDTPYS